MNLPADQQLIVQSVAKAAAKTFMQAFLAVLVLLLVPILTRWAVDVSGGGQIDLDVHFFANILIAAVGGGIAALISFLQNRIGVIPS